MNQEDRKLGIEENILQAIKEGQLKMRPRWHFVLQGILVAIGGFIVAAALLYLISFIIFMTQKTGVWFVPSFGLLGWYEFLYSLPWVLIVLIIAFILILELLVRRYSFAYRRPLLYSVLGLTVLVLCGGVVVSQTTLHQKLFHIAEKGHLPFAGPMYRDVGHRRLDKVHRGMVTLIMKDGFQMETERQEPYRVVIVPQTRLSRGARIERGDMVVVFGPSDHNTIIAIGIQELSEPGW